MSIILYFLAESFFFKFLSRDLQKRGGKRPFAPPPVHHFRWYDIMGLGSSEYTGGRVHFPGLIELVSELPGCVWGPLTRNSDLSCDGETTNTSILQWMKTEDLCWGTLSRVASRKMVLFLTLKSSTHLSRVLGAPQAKFSRNNNDFARFSSKR